MIIRLNKIQQIRCSRELIILFLSDIILITHCKKRKNENNFSINVFINDCKYHGAKTLKYRI